VAPNGTVAWIWVGAVTPNEARLLLNSTLVATAKFKPSTITNMFVALRAGENPVMRGATRKSLAVFAVPVGLVMRIGPMVASTGTVAVIRVSDATVKSAGAVSNLTSVAVAKPDPLITTWVPGRPRAGEKLPTTGSARSGPPHRKNETASAPAPARRRFLARDILPTRKVN